MNRDAENFNKILSQQQQIKRIIQKNYVTKWDYIREARVV